MIGNEFENVPETQNNPALKPCFQASEPYSVVGHFLKWYLADGPSFFWQVMESILIRTVDNFSIEYLFKTLFAPWKRDVVYAQNATLQQRFQIKVWNLLSRLIGFVIRSITIFVGLLVIAILFLLMLTLYVFWFLIPLAIVVFLVLIIL